MASRFIDTEIWKEDWFCELGGEYQAFWTYITCHCNNAGIWKPNKIDFEIKSRTKINMVAFLEKVNERGCKDRIIVIDSGRWFITGFIAFQWFNKKKSFDLVLSNKLHKHLYELILSDSIPLEKVRGLGEVLKGSIKTSMVMDPNSTSLTINKNEDNGGLGEVLKGSKQTDKTYSPLLSEYGNVSPQEAESRYLTQDRYKGSIEQYAMVKITTVENIHEWVKQFTSILIRQCWKNTMEEWLKYFNNWFMKNYKLGTKDANQQQTEDYKKRREQLLEQTRLRNSGAS